MSDSLTIAKGKRRTVIAIDPGSIQISEDGTTVTAAVEGVTFHGYAKSHEKRMQAKWAKAQGEED